MSRTRRGSNNGGILTFITKLALLLTAAVLTVITTSPAYAAVEHYGNFDVQGRILDEYKYQGGPGKLGNPTIAESPAAVAGTKFQSFALDASIYWNANVASGFAKMVRGDIRAKWGEYNFERGPFGYPTISEAALAKNGGKYNTFQGGSIYWSPITGAHQIWGNIRDQWGQQGYENGPLGYPVTDEFTEYGGFRQEFEGAVLPTTFPLWIPILMGPTRS